MFFKDELQFLSNFYKTKILYLGTFWPSVEHAYQAAKCEDLEMNEYIRSLDHSSEARKVGRRIKFRSDWEEVKVNIMTDLVFLKFDQNEKLKKRLLATGNIELEEGNWWHDNFWGNCYCDGCKNIVGENVLGIILMEVRSFFGERNGKFLKDV